MEDVLQPMEDVLQQPVRAYNRGRTRSRRGQQGVRAFNEAGVLEDDPPPAAAPPIPAAAPPVPAAAPPVPAAAPVVLAAPPPYSCTSSGIQQG